MAVLVVQYTNMSWACSIFVWPYSLHCYLLQSRTKYMELICQLQVSCCSDDFLWKSLYERSCHFFKTRIVLEWILLIGLERVDWMHLDQDMDQRRALVKTVI